VIRRFTLLPLLAGLLLLGCALSLPFYGWAGLQTEGPAIATLGGVALLVARRGQRYVAALVAAAAIAGCVLIIRRLANPPSSSLPILQAILRVALSRVSLGIALGGAVIVGLTACAELLRAGRASRPAARIPLDAEQRAAVSVAWRALWTSRLLLWVVGVAAVLVFGSHANVSGTSLARPFGSLGNKLVAPATAWDASAYLTIAQHGYANGPYFQAFFPLYPILIRLGAWSPKAAALTGIAVSIAALTASLYLLYRLVALDFGERAARTTVLLVAFFPTALFFSAIYTESLFLALSVGAIYAARRGWWARAGLSGALAAATRANGVLVVVPLVILYFYGPREEPLSTPPHSIRRYPLRTDFAFVLLVPLGALLYLAYMGAHGDWLAPFHSAKTFWGRTFTPGLGLVHGVRDAVRSLHQLFVGSGRHVLPSPPNGELAHPIRLATVNLTDFAFLAGGLACLLGAIRRLPFAYWAYGLASLAVALSTVVVTEPLASLPRYLAVVFPFQLTLALWIGDRRWRAMGLVLSGILMVLLGSEFARGLWVA
jgi:hypothetical protein